MTNVDKAVCTNDVLEDLNRAIKFETVFSTLIENKILAIKRECEEKQKSKRSRSFARFLFGRRVFVDRSNQPSPQNNNHQYNDGDNNGPNAGIELPQTRVSEFAVNSSINHPAPNGQFVLVDERNEKTSSLSVENPVDNSHDEGEAAKISGNREIVVDLSEHVVVAENRTTTTTTRPTSVIHHEDEDSKYDVISIRSDMWRTGGEPSSSCRTMQAGQVSSLVTAQNGKRSQSDDLIARSNNKSHILRSSLGSSSCAKTGRGANKTRFTDYVVEIDDSRQIRVNSKSILSSSSTSSLQSNPPAAAAVIDPSAKPHTSAINTSSPTITNNSNSIFGVEENGREGFNPREASLLLERERYRLRVLEAKSISAQCSPIMPRHTDIDYSISSSAPHSLNPYQPEEPISFTEGRSAVADTSERSHHSSSHHRHRHGHHHGRRKAKKHRTAEFVAGQLDYGDLVNYQMVNPMTQGIISSFNQLKSPNLPAVIASANNQASIGEPTTTSSSAAAAPSAASSKTTKQSTATQPQGEGKGGKRGVGGKKIQKMPSTTSTGGESTVANTGCCARKSTKKTCSGHVTSAAADGNADENANNDAAEQKQRDHQYSDPILIYSSAGGATSMSTMQQHCILSRPPNQPIEFHYNNDDFLYDVALQIEPPDVEGEGGPINPSKPHRHHRHKHKHRHKHDHGLDNVKSGSHKQQKKKKKKRKILVHDLDDQSVKVIDPDDLPQRARWTIIATACLLLIMCLLLVGVTLRMAPIIDDMGHGKKRPPKLKNTDRTISITIENYKPPAPIIIDSDEVIIEEGNLLLPPHPTSAPLIHEYHAGSSQNLSAPASKANIFYVDSGPGSPSAMNYDDGNQLLHPQQYSSAGRDSFRRSDTLDVCSPALMQLRKTRSFHSNEPLLVPNVEDLLLVRRTSNSSNSNRSSQQLLVPVVQQAPLATPERSPLSDRRNYSVHRSFNDVVKQRLVARKLAMKCNSFSENMFPQMAEVQAVVAPEEIVDMDAENEMLMNEIMMDRNKENVRKFNSANTSVERDGEIIYRSRSNSRNRLQLPPSSLDDEIIIDYSPRPQMRSASMKQSQNSMSEIQQQQQQQQQHQYFKRGARQAQSFYLSPHSYDELRVTRSPRSIHPDNRKVYSSSVKYKYNDKDSAKKSKSFIADMLPVPKMMNFEGGSISPYNWESGKRYMNDEAGIQTGKLPGQRSPRLSQSIKLGASGGGQLRAFERRTSSLGYDISPGANSNSNLSLIASSSSPNANKMDLEDYEAVIRSFQRKSQRKGSLGSGQRPSTKMSIKKKSLTGDDMKGDNIEGIVEGKGLSIEEEEELLRKRKKIICIITTVFFSLVIASVCVVIVMLTHTSGYSTGGSNHPKKTYVARGSPIHYNSNLRQENERLMQESLNRAKFAKNFTDVTPLAAAQEEIP